MRLPFLWKCWIIATKYTTINIIFAHRKHNKCIWLLWLMMIIENDNDFMTIFCILFHISVFSLFFALALRRHFHSSICFILIGDCLCFKCFFLFFCFLPLLCDYINIWSDFLCSYFITGLKKYKCWLYWLDYVASKSILLRWILSRLYRPGICTLESVSLCNCHHTHLHTHTYKHSHNMKFTEVMRTWAWFFISFAFISHDIDLCMWHLVSIFFPDSFFSERENRHEPKMDINTCEYAKDICECVNQLAGI